MSTTYRRPRKAVCAACGAETPAKELTATVEVLQVCPACAAKQHVLCDAGSGAAKSASAYLGDLDRIPVFESEAELLDWLETQDPEFATERRKARAAKDGSGMPPEAARGAAVIVDILREPEFRRIGLRWLEKPRLRARLQKLTFEEFKARWSQLATTDEEEGDLTPSEATYVLFRAMVDTPEPVLRKLLEVKGGVR